MTFEAPRMSLLIFTLAFSFLVSSITALVASIKDDNATLTHEAPLDDIAENYHKAPPTPQIYAAGLLHKNRNAPEEAPGPEETRHRRHHRRHHGRDDDEDAPEAAPGPEKARHGHRHRNNGEGHRHNHRHGRKRHGKHGSHHDQEGHGHAPKMAPGPEADTQNSGL
ncbi:unnamed protein product [Linum tenue]|uniref:Uncharacterized protein n=1 Tax=Linum tenue TaxID=586396 RepID=A0AAV0HL96_9ROSI|nr:unnamed protein product [Linum tenue]